jgi:hypothetical protein
VFGGGSQAVNGAGLKIRAVRKPVPQARRAEGFVGSNPTPRTSSLRWPLVRRKVPREGVERRRLTAYLAVKERRT